MRLNVGLLYLSVLCPPIQSAGRPKKIIRSVIVIVQMCGVLKRGSVRFSIRSFDHLAFMYTWMYAKASCDASPQTPMCKNKGKPARFLPASPPPPLSFSQFSVSFAVIKLVSAPRSSFHFLARSGYDTWAFQCAPWNVVHRCKSN